MTNFTQIVAELKEWEAETGRTLPMPAAEIARIEATGRHVDLCTGAVVNPRVYLQTFVEIDGENAIDVCRMLRDSFNDGRLDLAILTVLSDELRGKPGDWRLVRCDSSAAELHR